MRYGGQGRVDTEKLAAALPMIERRPAIRGEGSEIWYGLMGSPHIVQDYIETLERAILATWVQWDREGWTFQSCAQCGAREAGYEFYPHAPNCIVPPLVEKYAS